jgi:DNA polymerase III subunit delta
LPMPASNERALRAAIKGRTFEPVYYLFGDDDFRKDDAVAAVIATAVDPGVRDFNVDVRRGNEIDAETLGAFLDTPPMMSDRRVVVVRDVAALKKDARSALDRYLDRPARDTVVLLVATAGGKADKVLADVASAIEFAPLRGDKLGDWIAARVKKVEAAITPEAVVLLQDSIGEDIGQLAIEIDKLASYAQGQGRDTIDEDAVAAIVGVTKEETLGRLLDCVAERDARNALAVLPRVLALPKTTGVQIVMALTTQTLALAHGLATHARGPGEYFGLLKETGPYLGRAWGEAVNTFVRSASAWTPPALDRALDALLAADHALKESRVSDEEQVLVSLILTLCAT